MLDPTLNSCFNLDPVYPFNNPAGCYANGQIRAHGDRWREDDCTFCQCINGEPHCVATACGQSCMHPVKVPGECCPVCEGKPCSSDGCLANVSCWRSSYLYVLVCFLFPQSLCLPHAVTSYRSIYYTALIHYLRKMLQI